ALRVPSVVVVPWTTTRSATMSTPSRAVRAADDRRPAAPASASRRTVMSRPSVASMSLRDALRMLPRLYSQSRTPPPEAGLAVNRTTTWCAAAVTPALVHRTSAVVPSVPSNLITVPPWHGLGTSSESVTAALLLGLMRLYAVPPAADAAAVTLAPGVPWQVCTCRVTTSSV